MRSKLLSVMLLTLGLLTLFVFLVSFLPLLHQTHWVIRVLDFPRVQLSVIALLVLIAHSIFLDTQQFMPCMLVAITAVCFIWQIWWILPYTPVWPKEVLGCVGAAADKQLSVLTSNVLTPNRNAEALVELVRIHQPDVLVTLESDQWWEDQLAVLEIDMPYSIKCPLDNLYGMHVYSKLPLDEQEICYFVEEGVPSIHTSIELRTGDKIRAHFLHPAPPSPTENTQSAERDAELMIVARSVGDTDHPVIVAGDLNDVAWSATTRLFRKISGLLDPRVGRGIFSTFHAGYPLMRWPLDHLFHSQHFVLKDIRCLPAIGSDHFPLLTRLTFTSTHGTCQKGIKPDVSEREWAKEMSDEKDVSKGDVPKPGEDHSKA